MLTRGPLDETVPIGNAAMKERTFIEWDKDDLEALGLMKVDVLGLGMLTCIRKAFELLAAHKGLKLTLATVPAEDGQVWDMICRADTVGVFQIESRAQMNMLPRLKPRSFYDLVIEVAIVRPGPIQGDMVHPYLRRRDGLEEVVYPAPAPEHGPPDELRKVLEKTLGVPLFQEQAMRVAMEAALFTPDEADALRHAMATFRKRGTLGLLRDRMVGRMTARGYDPELAARCFRQIEGFGDYGFPESHAASFALLAYVSSWLKCRHPEVFACALLNAQPMGFYAPAQIVRDAREHGVEVRPVDVHASGWDNSLEPAANEGHALRLGLRQITGLGEEDAKRILKARDGLWPDIAAMQRGTGLGAAAIETLAAADAFGSMGLDRRGALWQARALAKAPALPLFEAAGGSAEGAEPPAALPAMAPGEQVVEGLPDAQALAPGASVLLPAGAPDKAGRACGRGHRPLPGRRARLRRRARARPPAPRQRQRRHLHDAGGRNRRREHRGLAARAGALSQGGAGRAGRDGPGPRPAHGRYRPSCRRTAGGPDRLARPADAG